MPVKKDGKTSSFFTNARRVISCYTFNFLEFLAVKNKFFNKYLMNLRKPVFENDIEMAKPSKNDKILLIACGIFPFHTITIAQKIKAKVTGIDNSQGAVKAARKYVKKNDLSDIVKIEYGNGQSYPVKHFDLIFIAGNVWPIDNVLLHLSKNMRKGGRVLCKSINHDIPNTLRSSDLDHSFLIVSMTENPKTQTYLLVKK